MNKFGWKKTAKVSLSIMLLLSFLVLTACGKSTAKNDTQGASSTQAGSSYDNSYSKDGVPSKMLTELRKKGTLTIGSSGDAPFAYIDQKTNKFSGVDAEIIKEAAKRLGIAKVDMKLISFSELILNLNQGNIDMIADCMYIRKDRAEKVYFGEIWYTQGGGLLVPKEGTIKGIEDFNPSSTVIGYTPGTVWQTTVEGWKEKGLIKEARATGDQSESIVAIQHKKIDGFLTDSTVLENLFANSPDTVSGLKLAENYKDDAATIGRIAPSVTFDNIAFMKEVDAVVAKMREEGVIKKIFEDYKLDPNLHMITNDKRTHDINTKTE
jgi:polar amino acid transport system substrate-binding protein